MTSVHVLPLGAVAVSLDVVAATLVVGEDGADLQYNMI